MEKPNIKRIKFALYIGIMYIILLFGLGYAVISLITKPFFYIHNSLLNSKYSEKISEEYIETDFIVNWEHDFMTVSKYEYIYEVNGKEYSLNYYLDYYEENEKGYVLYYNKNNPEDSFLYKKYSSINNNLFICYIFFVFVGVSILLYLLYRIIDFYFLSKRPKKKIY